MGWVDMQDKLIIRIKRKIIVKRRFYILALLSLLMAVTGCDKRDCNGDLDGMWQMLEWRDKENVVKATKDDMIFYSFQLQMADFRKVGNEIRTSLKVTPEQIIIYDPIKYKGNGHDGFLPMSELSSFGVPEDGIMWIQVLTGSRMELKTNNQDILIFRKY